jgi:pyruvate dehydrogenase E2 component (dihydrolipoamide acetyltransferase)
MPVEVILPKVDMDMTTGQISRWFVTEGAAVRQGDLLFEIETDKAAMEIDAPASGIIRNITGKQGVDIPVGHTVAWIYAEGEDPATAPPSPSDERRDAASGDHATTAEEETRSPAVPALRTEPSPEVKSRATPLARRLAREAGLDLSALPGSGPRGRVTRTDVEAAMASRRVEGDGRGREDASAASAAVKRDPEVATGPDTLREKNGDPVLKLFDEASYELVPHDGMRKTIARRLVEAKSTIPHFYLSVDCELDALLALRKQLNDAAPMKAGGTGGEPSYRLSVNDMIIKALALALIEVPDANVSWTEKAMIRHRHADVGVAVTIPGGLITPVLRRAEEKSLSTIAAEMKDLAARARSRRLKPEEYQGGTTALSNLGMFGIRNFAAIINPPHATILAVGAAEARAVARNGEVKAATVMSATLSTDHRAVDGALGAELLGAFRRLVENPLRLLV